MLELLLFPIQFCIGIMQWLVQDFGLAIILFSIVLYYLLSPLRKWALAIQNKTALQQQNIQPQIDYIKKNFKGEQQHNELEKLYKKEGYSPFSPLKGLLGFLTQIPILILVYYSLLNYAELTNQTFVGIMPLDKNDALLKISSTFAINILPIVMWGVGIISACLLKPNDEINLQTVRKQQKQGVLINTLFLLLLYSQPASVVLYWTINNFLDMFSRLKKN